MVGAPNFQDWNLAFYMNAANFSMLGQKHLSDV